MTFPFRNETKEAKRWISASISDEYFLAVFTVGMRSLSNEWSDAAVVENAKHSDCFFEVIEGLQVGSKIVLVEFDPVFNQIYFAVEHESLEWVMPGEFVPYRHVTLRRSCAVIDSPHGGGH